MEKLEITLKNSEVHTWTASKGEWDDYFYNGPTFVVKKDGQWVGIYNMDSVVCVTVR